MAEETANSTELKKVHKALNQRPIYIFGPCSAENRDQVVDTAIEIARFHPNAIYRAGIWKPRTRPNNFEGIGEIGLKWLQEAGDKSGLPVATEVANTKHVEAALQHHVDILWIGARTTVNPFYVQEIAESLKGVDIPVMVKNPVVPDFNLWLGAIERFEKIGIKQVVAIHRGFHHFDSKPFRNSPQWGIPIQLLTNRPEIPIICDISHIAGNPDLFPSLAQKAIDLNMNGLHIEVHPSPANALSDANQQIKVEQLQSLLSGIEWRSPSTDNPDFLVTLQNLRQDINGIDDALIKNFFKRMEMIRKIGILKKGNQVTILQVERWKKIEEHYMTEGRALGLSESFLSELLTLIHDESMRIQYEVMNS